MNEYEMWHVFVLLVSAQMAVGIGKTLGLAVWARIERRLITRRHKREMAAAVRAEVTRMVRLERR